MTIWMRPAAAQLPGGLGCRLFCGFLHLNMNRFVCECSDCDVVLGKPGSKGVSNARKLNTSSGKIRKLNQLWALNWNEDEDKLQFAPGGAKRRCRGGGHEKIMERN